MRMRPTTRSLALLTLSALALAAGPIAWADGAASAPVDAAGDIRDIRPPLPGPEPTVWTGTVIGCVLMLLGGAGAGLWLHRRSRQRPLAPWQVALRRLEEAAGLMQRENAYAFSIAMSEAVRSYLEKRFAMPISHQTTAEFLSDLAQDEDGELRRWRSFLQNFLDHCDLAKYARWQLELEDMEAMYASARRLVLATRPPLPRRRFLRLPRTARGAPPAHALHPAQEGGPR